MSLKDYTNCTDEELIAFSRSGDSAATDFLMERYKGLVRSRAATLHIPGGDQDDLIQEGMLGLFKALRDYDPSKGASFSTFASLCISRQMYTAIEASGRQKHQPLNEAVSYDRPVNRPGTANGGNDHISQQSDSDAGNGSQNYLDSLASPDEDPETRYISEENRRLLEQEIHDSLSPFEREVLNLYLSDLNYVEIADRLGRDPKSTDNALQRIKNKIRRLL